MWRSATCIRHLGKSGKSFPKEFGLTEKLFYSDTELGGFKIPKNTHILSNLYGIHMDENTWKNPEKFDPTRFLKDGKLNKSDNFMPFSVGE